MESPQLNVLKAGFLQEALREGISMQCCLGRKVGRGRLLIAFSHDSRIVITIRHRCWDYAIRRAQR